MKKYCLNFFKKYFIKILAVICIVAISVALVKVYTPENISQTFSKTSILPTVVIDAGHAALENTIKQHKSIAK